MVRSLEAVRSGSQDKKPVEVTFEELVTGNGEFHRMNSSKRWASIQRLIPCRTYLLCLSRISVGLFRRLSVLLSLWVCVKHRSIRTSSLQTNPLTDCKQLCRWLICRMLLLQRLTKQKLFPWVMLVSDKIS